jgi:hypothetical protein
VGDRIFALPCCRAHAHARRHAHRALWFTTCQQSPAIGYAHVHATGATRPPPTHLRLDFLPPEAAHRPGLGVGEYARVPLVRVRQDRHCALLAVRREVCHQRRHARRVRASPLVTFDLFLSPPPAVCRVCAQDPGTLIGSCKVGQQGPIQGRVDVTKFSNLLPENYGCEKKLHFRGSQIKLSHVGLSHLELSGVLTAFMPAAVRFYCMLLTSDLGILAITTNETLSKHLAEIRKWRATPPALRVDALAVTRPTAGDRAHPTTAPSSTLWAGAIPRAPSMNGPPRAPSR